MSRLLLIDGHSILFRAFYGMPLAMTAPDGRHTNAVYGFLAIVGKVVEEEKPDFLAVAFDLAAPTFRHRLYPEYKGNRAPAPEEFHEQVPVMKQLLADMGIPVVTCEGWEADDILGTLASKAEKDGTEVTILSGDRDLLQLADDHTRIVIPKTKGGQTAYERYTPAEVQAAFGVSPEDFIQLKALMGDSSDNVPGLPGVGPKTALKIMQTFGSIESAHEHVGEIRPKKAMEAMRDHYDDLMLSLDLVTIRRNAPVEYDRKTFAFGSPWTEAALRDCRELGFRSIVSRYEDSGKKPEPQPDDFRRITELAAFEETLRAAAAAPAAGVSAETAGGRLFAAAVAFGDETAVVAPGGFLTQEVIRDGFRRLLHKRTAETACMHAKELIRFCGFTDASRLFDCVIASYLLDPLKSDWDYEAIAQGALGRSVPSEDDLLGKKGLAGLNGMTDEEAEEKAVLLAGYEASVALQAEKPLEEKLKETGMLALFESVEMPLTAVLASMEEAGIRASREALARYGNELDAHIKELTGRIFAEAGEEFNLNSPKQLGEILFGKIGIPGGRKTKTGYSTAAGVLEKLSDDYPIAADILAYRTYSKLKSTYADGLPSFIGPDGRIHTTFNQTVTATGRLSSTDPNLQNIPMREELGRRIRKCFCPEEGNVFVDADYSQIELRILAHMSGDEKLIEAYRQAKDIHRITASQVFHVPFDEVTDQQRRNAKAVNFGIVYGISSFGLSQGLSISTKEAQEYIRQYFAAYPKIKSFLDGLVSSAKEKGYAVSLFGRRRPVPELKASAFAQRSFGERVAMNSPIQGTAADIIKIAMIRVFRRLAEEVPEARLILQIHDELLVEAPAERAEEVMRILTEEMGKAADLSVSLETDCHTGSDWYEAK